METLFPATSSSPPAASAVHPYLRFHYYYKSMRPPAYSRFHVLVVVVEGIYAFDQPAASRQNKQNKGGSASPRFIQKVKILQTFFAPPVKASWMGRTI
jgi:hypothetical protein